LTYFLTEFLKPILVPLDLHCWRFHMLMTTQWQ